MNDKIKGFLEYTATGTLILIAFGRVDIVPWFSVGSIIASFITPLIFDKKND